jgi:hypothetical protein
MPADPIHLDQLDGEQRFHADLVVYMDSLPVGKLAELLGELPRSRQEPLGLGVLMVALNERLPDAYKLLPPAGHPGRARAGAARCCRWSLTAAPPAQPHTDAPASGLAEWLADRLQQADLHAERARAGAVGERRVAEQAAGRHEHDAPQAEPAERERTSRGRSATASPRTADPDYRSRRADGRSVLCLSAVAGLSAVLSTAGSSVPRRVRCPCRVGR